VRDDRTLRRLADALRAGLFAGVVVLPLTGHGDGAWSMLLVAITALVLRWARAPAAADLLFVATGAARPVVLAGELADAMAARSGRPLTVIDLGVPRNVEPEARAVPALTLFDLDDLQRLCCPAAGTATAALREAQAMVNDEIARLELTLRGRAAAPRLAELHRLGVQVAEQEAAWALAQLSDLSERDQRVVREMAERLVRRVLYPVSRSLREERVVSEAELPGAS
jgi:glutamyl-tRNA reductase